MFINTLLTLTTDQNIASSWIGFTFLGGLIGLFIGIVLIRPLSYGIALLKPLAYILQKSLNFIEEGEFEFLLMIAMPILSPILGIGVGVSVSQSIFFSQIGITTATSWIIFTGFAHFIPTFLYSILFHVPTALSFASQSPNILKIKEIIKRTEAILIFVIWGSLIGLAQWILVREHFSHSNLWFFLSASGISVGIFIGNFISLFLSIVFGKRSILLLFYSTGLFALIPYGFFTGKLLEFFLNHD